MDERSGLYGMTIIETLCDPYYRTEFVRRLGQHLSRYGLNLPAAGDGGNPEGGADASEALALVAGAVCTCLPADAASVILFTEWDGSAYLSGSAACDGAGDSSERLDGASDRLVERVISHPASTAIEVSSSEEAAEARVATAVEALLATPIYISGNKGGLVAAVRVSEERTAESAGTTLALIAAMVGGVLDQLANEVANEDRLRSLAKGLSAALDARDPKTKGHSDRTAMYAMAMVNEMSPAEDLDRYQKLRSSVRLGALLHDIGKIGIPDHILLKPDSLTNEEYDLIKHHPLIGAEILNSCHGFEHLVPGVLYHHERASGKGYPFGIGGDKIPPMARIIGLADAFDAITSDRPFREASSHDEAIEILRKLVPGTYDQTAFEALVRAHEKGALKDVRIPSRSARLPESSEENIERVFGSQVKSVPSLPPVLATISSLVDDPGASLKEIAKVLATDEGLASRALKLVNSAYYGLPQTIATIPLAVTVLGARAIKSYLVNIALSDLMHVLSGGREEYRLLWSHALKTALWAKAIAGKMGLADREEAFTAGLVHDIGKALALRLKPADYSKVVVEAERSGNALMAVEKEVLGFDHTEIGAWAGTKWMLPDTLIHPIRWHHDPDGLVEECKELGNLVTEIHIAHELARRKPADEPACVLASDTVSPGTTERFGQQALTELESLKDEVERQEQALWDTFVHSKRGADTRQRRSTGHKGAL
jgi:putative nucleotidyltransferase with HDIG domain